jgi:hypothetical protein
MIIVGLVIFVILLILHRHNTQRSMNTNTSTTTTKVVKKYGPRYGPSYNPASTPYVNPVVSWWDNIFRKDYIGGCAGTRYGCCPGTNQPKRDPSGSNCARRL